MRSVEDLSAPLRLKAGPSSNVSATMGLFGSMPETSIFCVASGVGVGSGVGSGVGVGVGSGVGVGVGVGSSVGLEVSSAVSELT